MERLDKFLCDSGVVGSLAAPFDLPPDLVPVDELEVCCPDWADPLPLFSAQPGHTNAETSASTTTRAAARTAAINLPWEEEFCVSDMLVIVSQT